MLGNTLSVSQLSIESFFLIAVLKWVSDEFNIMPARSGVKIPVIDHQKIEKRVLSATDQLVHTTESYCSFCFIKWVAVHVFLMPPWLGC